MQKVKLYKNNGHVFIIASDCVTTMGYRLQLANYGSMFMYIEQVDSIGTCIFLAHVECMGAD